ncbi:MAG: hypothetical protein AAF570_03835 [Bacteroidota bacterium]
MSDFARKSVSGGRRVQTLSAKGRSAAQPPQFKVAASPLQFKTDPNETGEALQEEFLLFQEENAALLEGDKAKAFITDCLEFIALMDRMTEMGFGGDMGWGSDYYDSELATRFPGYQSVIDGETANRKKEAVQAAHEVYSQSGESLKLAEHALVLAEQDLAEAEHYAAEAKEMAMKAEALAREAAVNATSADAGEEEWTAAKESLAAAERAVKAADRAQIALSAIRKQRNEADELVADAKAMHKTAGLLLQEAESVDHWRDAERKTKLVETVGENQTALADKIEGTPGTEKNLAKVQDAHTAALDGHHDANVARIQSEPMEGLRALLADHEAQSRRSKKRDEAAKLFEYVHSITQSYPEKVSSFIAQSHLTTDEKLKTVGELSVLASRIEFLTGTIYLEGSGKSSKNNWQQDKEWSLHKTYARDLGYTDKRIEDRNNDNDPDNDTSWEAMTWCSIYQGYIQKNCVGRKSLKGKDPRDDNHWSGLKLSKTEHWDYEDNGGKIVGSGAGNREDDSWVNLKESVSNAADDAEKKQLINSFFAEKGYVPQAGDYIIITRGADTEDNRFGAGSKSHTGIVERFDPKEMLIYTLEGNSDKQVKGRVLDLKKPEDVGRIVFMSRMGLGTLEMGEAPADGEKISGEELLAPLQKLDSILQSFATENGYLVDAEAGAPNVLDNIQQWGNEN